METLGVTIIGKIIVKQREKHGGRITAQSSNLEEFLKGGWWRKLYNIRGIRDEKRFRAWAQRAV